MAACKHQFESIIGKRVVHFRLFLGEGFGNLGIGILEPTPDFGRMIDRSLGYLQTDPAYVLFPGLLLFVMVLAFNMFGDALRDALDPRTGPGPR